jgi:hypothetical protein
VTELESLADLALASATAYGDAAARARPASATWERSPMESFLEAAERVVQLERQADTAERAVMADVMQQTAPDARRLVLVTRVAHHLEETTDALALAVLRLRDRTTGASGP